MTQDRVILVDGDQDGIMMDGDWDGSLIGSQVGSLVGTMMMITTARAKLERVPSHLLTFGEIGKDQVPHHLCLHRQAALAVLAAVTTNLAGLGREYPERLPSHLVIGATMVGI